MRRVLTFIGRDRWDMPVYQDDTGQLWKDIDCREGQEDILYTCEDNELEGKPDYPMDTLDDYWFYPKRIKDPPSKELKMVVLI